MSSVRSTSDSRGPVTRKRVPDREEPGKPRKDVQRGRCHPLEAGFWPLWMTQLPWTNITEYCARGHARRRGAAGRAPAGGKHDGRRRGRATRRRAPGVRRDAAAAPARGARAGAPARARSATFNLERADEGFKLLKFAHKKSKFEIQNPMLTLGLLIDSKNLFIGQYDKLFEEYWLSPISYLSPYRG